MAKKYLHLTAFICIACAALTGCGSGKSVVAKVGKHVITKGEMEQRIARMPAYYQESVKKNMEAYLDEVIVDLVLYDEALKRKLDKDKEMQQIFREAQKKILIARLIKDQIEDKTSVSDKDIEDYYQQNQDRFMSEEKLRASHILVKDENLAMDILLRLQSGEDFQALAGQYSIDPTSEKGGDIGYFTRGQLVPEFESACFKLKAGEISGIVKTQFGFHIIKLTEMIPPAEIPLDKSKDTIKDELLKIKKRKAFNDFVQGLKKRTLIQTKPELLN